MYNGAASLPASIASLEALTFDGLAFMVADDGSSDGSEAILSDWAARDRRVQVVRHAHNLGTISNFEWLAERAETPFFMFAAQDDAWSPNYASALHAALTAEQGADLAVSSIVLMSENFSRQYRRISFDVRLREGSRVRRARRLLRQASSGWFYGLYRRQALLRALAPVRRFGNPWGHDFVTLLPFLIEARVTGDDKAVFYKRISNASESRLMPRTLAAEWDIYRMFTRECTSALAAAPLSPLEKAYLAAFLPKYAGRHSKKLGRIIRRAIMDAVAVVNPVRHRPRG